MPKPASNKFRPLLSKAAIYKILELCTKEDPADPAIKEIKQTLGVLTYKVSEGLIGAAYVTRPRATIEEKLGFSEGEIILSDPIEARRVAFHKYLDNPSALSEKELALAFTYRYEEGLMTPEEQAEYEGKLFGTSVV